MLNFYQSKKKQHIKFLIRNSLLFPIDFSLFGFSYLNDQQADLIVNQSGIQIFDAGNRVYIME